MTIAPTDQEFAAYANVVRAMLARGGFERTGNAAEARRWDIAHIVSYLTDHGRPDRRRTVHVAGSKGKGSAAVLTEAILRETGEHTLLLTSPDLHSARERVAIDGRPLDHPAFTRLARLLLDDPATAGWSYFELLTVMGWLAGAEAGCDRQVLEVGLGGRLDTTNAVAEKDVAVVMPVDLEHMEILGDTIEQIAGEKAGIITGPCEVVAAPMRESALRVIRARAAEQGARLHEVTEECAMRVTAHSIDGLKLDLKTPLRLYRALQSPLVGQQQAENLAAAVRAAELAREVAGEELPEAAVRRALQAVHLPGRFEVVRRRPLVILDGMHTPLAAKRFREALDGAGVPRRRTWVIGVLAGKSVEEMLRPLIEEGDTVFVAPPPSPRAADPAEVARIVRACGGVPQRMIDIPQAIEAALAVADPRDAVIVAGSLYSVAAAREHLLGIAGDHALGLR
jgi:dihydrofolate synthase / folylpolyglutamate synthase